MRASLPFFRVSLFFVSSTRSRGVCSCWQAHRIVKDRIGDVSIKFQFGSEETWTRALRHVRRLLSPLPSPPTAFALAEAGQ